MSSNTDFVWVGYVDLSTARPIVLTPAPFREDNVVLARRIFWNELKKTSSRESSRCLEICLEQLGFTSLYHQNER